ncbi:serine/threonine-protein kinase [Streptomyces sp. NRRL S-31]|uniref:serine/threonine-protein kinase n=1 Tax=Streptomyces sp. NRRL S-31 TaxID=1463898 RepID=UPI002657535F|nr:serine/threonine-protein kinase [Streptomyces sp. NRRL S-31]
MSGKIGSGGMADVYEGTDTRLRRPVAVKVFRPGSDPRTEERLAAEAVLLARLEHPGLVTVYDAGRHDDRTYLVMQLVNGPTLRGLLADGALPQRRVTGLGSALAGALAHVHRAGIVHRDVKPSNVLLGTADDPHLADFGIARLTDATRHTASDVLTGTAAYLAPEQVAGRHVGPAVDVYALGLVLLECLKGELEYQGTPLEAAIARLHRPPTIPARLDPDLAALLRAMTAQDPGARPDAEQCAQVLSSLHASRNAGLSADHEPQPLPLSLPLSVPSTVDRPAAPRPTPPETEALLRTEPAATARSGPPSSARPNRRLVVGTALAALSVALGATFTVASGTSESTDDHADAPSTTAPSGHPTTGTTAPENKRATAPPTVGSHRAQPPSRTSDTSGSVVPAHAEPVSLSPDPSGRAIPTHRAPVRQDGAEPRTPTPHHHRGTDDHPRHTSHAAPNPPGKANKPAHHPKRKNHG